MQFERNRPILITAPVAAVAVVYSDPPDHRENNQTNQPTKPPCCCLFFCRHINPLSKELIVTNY